MSTSALEVRKPLVLADLIDSPIIRNLALVVGYATFIGIFAQISFRLSFTPVPITGQTFAVLLGAASLGPIRAVAGSALYAIAGVGGLPWFAGATGGWHIATGPTFGYILSYVFVAVVVGLLAQHGLDRSFAGAALVMVLGSMIIYAVGVSWLGLSIHVSASKAISLGMTPFIIGDLFKLLLAAFMLPTAWWGVNRFVK